MADVPDRLRVALQDRYAVERELGQGGMATVYLAEDLRHKRFPLDPVSVSEGRREAGRRVGHGGSE